VAWSNIGHFLSLLSEDDYLCRGNALWEATVQWVWQIHGTVGQEDSGKAGFSLAEKGFSELFEHLRACVEVFLNDGSLELSTGDPEVESVVRLVVIACDSSLKFSKNSESRQLTEGLFRQTMEVLQHAAGHVYASEGRTERAARILSGVLRHMNSTTASQGNSNEKSDGIATATQSIDNSMGIMEELLKTSGADILELLLRKLSTTPSTFSPVDRSSAFLDLAGELFMFMAVTVNSVHGLEVYFQFIENLVQRSRTVVLDKQSDRQKLTLSDWRSFVLAMKCLAWCSTALRAKPNLHTIHLVQALSQTVAEFDLSSEFPKPRFLYQGEAREDTSAETSMLVKKGWGRLVSDFIEAQWRCVEFLLEQEYSDSGGRQQRDKLEPFLATLPDAALEALSLGSGLSVVPVIRCVRLLTPRMLLTDDVLCSQALESVWWTFQDRQKGDHIWFWGTLREMTKVLFNPCLLVLPEEHPMTAVVRKYWGELLTLGEDRPGIVNHVIGPCCEVWANCQNSDPNPADEISEEDRKRSLEVHLDFLTEACVFGPRVKKTIRVTYYVLEYIRMLGEKREINPLYMDELRDYTRVRVNAINMLLTLNPENERDARLLKRVVRVLITKLDELTEEKPRSSINSYSHRRKHRVWQAILVALSQLFKADTEVMFAGEVLEETFRASVSENQVSVRNFLQWAMVLILGRYPSLEPLLWQQLIYDPDRRAGSVLSLITVAALVGEFSFSDPHSQAAYFQQAFPVILPWVLTPHVTVQAYAQVALQKMWLTCQRRNLHDVISNHSIIQSCVYFLETSKDGLRQKTRLLGDVFFLDCHPFRDFSIQTLFETLPRLAGVTDEEWISPKFLSQGSLGMRVWETSGADFRGLPLYNAEDTRLAQILNGVYVNCDESIGEQISRRLAGQLLNRSDTVQSSEAVNETNLCGPQSRDVQKKIMPWKVIPPDEEMISEMQEQRMANLQKSSSGNLIVVASLIDKAPNLGGLCRTCEIFGVQTLVLSNSHVIEDVQFKSLSVSAAKWMNLEEVRMSELKSYLENMRHEGYALVGVEQTANSVNLTRYQFPHKSLLLLGNEKEGIPVELIQMLDVCVEIPQVGVIRSLNVHVSGALLVWEYTRQRVLSGTS